MKPLYPVRLPKAARRIIPLPGARGNSRKLQEVTDFGSNPGALRAWSHVSNDLPSKAPLVVVLHGCTQNAADYDAAAGWSQLADELGFALLLPEQQRANNPNLCFNWFSPIDSRRDSGEALSIRQMIAAMTAAHDIDAHRVFVTGLSAGGAMTSIMLATYPELFAGGTIIAGLPFGAVASVGDAFSRMAGQGYPDEAGLASLVRAASAHAGPWPRISVWHGSADATVHPANSDRIIAQWRLLHGVETAASTEQQSAGHIRRTWQDGAGQTVLEQNIITGMGHGTPLTAVGPDACGTPAPYMLEVGVSSTRAIARSWGLGETKRPRRQPAVAGTAIVAKAAAVIPQIAKAVLPRPVAAIGQKGVGAIIEDALRAAGLMR